MTEKEIDMAAKSESAFLDMGDLPPVELPPTERIRLFIKVWKATPHGEVDQIARGFLDNPGRSQPVDLLISDLEQLTEAQDAEAEEQRQYVGRVSQFLQAFKIRNPGNDHLGVQINPNATSSENLVLTLLLSDLEYLITRVRVFPITRMLERLDKVGVIPPGTLLHMPGDYRSEDVQTIAEIVSAVAGHPNLAIITAPEISMVDEATMNAAGWFRKPF